MTTNFNYPPMELEEELTRITKILIAPGKGILCADETAAVMGTLFSNARIKNNEELRRKYRQLLFTADLKLSDYISGIILVQETVFQTSEDNTPFVQIIRQHGIMPGVSVDRGTVTLFGTDDECTTQGLDDLYDRCAEYKKFGFDFAKWHSIMKIGEHKPSYQAIIENANVLARFASICQSQGMVPIIEPEILSDGEHEIELSAKVTEIMLAAVLKSLSDHHVFMEGILLRPSMVTPGMQCKTKVLPEEIAFHTVTALRRTIPPSLPGILFSSGSQTEEDASAYLNAINQVQLIKPWSLTFAYGPALQTSVLRVWRGKDGNVEAAQSELLRLARDNSEAALGKFISKISPKLNLKFIAGIL